MGIKDIPIKTLTHSLPPIAETIHKYRIIYIGYVVSMAIFVATSVFEVFDAPGLINFLDNYNLDKIIFATMLFSVFMIVYFVRRDKGGRQLPEHRTGVEHLQGNSRPPKRQHIQPIRWTRERNKVHHKTSKIRGRGIQ